MSCGEPSVTSPVEGDGRGFQIAGECCCPGQPGAQPRTVGRIRGEAEGVSVGIHRPGIGTGHQEIGAQREQPRQVRALRPRPDGLQRRQGLPVGAERGRRFRCPQHPSHRRGLIPRLHQVVTDPGGRTVQRLERRRRLTVQSPYLGGQEPVQQGISQHGVPELVAGIGPNEQPVRECDIKDGVGLVLCQAGDLQEFVGVESAADDRGRGECLRLSIGQGRGQQGRSRQGCQSGSGAGQFDHRERQTLRRGPDSINEVVGDGR